MKPYWFKLTEDDESLPFSRKEYKAIATFFIVFIGVIGLYSLVPQKVADTPVDQTPSVESIPNPQPTIEKPILNPSNDEEDDD